MGLFKSEEERRIERDLEIKKGVAAVKRTIRELERNEKDYIEKAKRARQLGSSGQVDFLKKTIRKTAGQRLLLERQLLAIETAAQLKNQAETYGQFARSMNAVSRSIAEVFGDTDMARTQKDFERAMAQAQTMEQRMDLFLDLSAQSMFSGQTDAAAEDLVSEADIDRLLEDKVVHEEGDDLDREIDAGLDEIRRELGREQGA
ncbi:MAG: hypothetical protein HY722_09500 [Planctomycetes bacterium]|nr:hypothetical protein [Planctomycetota bacterium]